MMCGCVGYVLMSGWVMREKGEETGKPHGKTPRKYTPHYKDERRDRYIKIISSERTKRP